MSTPRLWSWHVSPFAGKARIAFAEKGMEVQLLEIDPRKRPARLRALNPTNRVPVLEIGGVAVRESTAICEWLEEVQPEPALWPADAGDLRSHGSSPGGEHATARAQARGMLRWVDDELTLNFFLSMRKDVFGIDSSDHPDIVAILRDRLLRRWATVEALLSDRDGPWLMGGEAPTIVDLAAIPLAVRLPAWKPDLAPPGDLVRTASWLEALRERPSAAEVDRRGEPVTDG